MGGLQTKMRGVSFCWGLSDRFTEEAPMDPASRVGQCLGNDAILRCWPGGVRRREPDEFAALFALPDLAQGDLAVGDPLRDCHLLTVVCPGRCAGLPVVGTLSWAGFGHLHRVLRVPGEIIPVVAVVFEGGHGWICLSCGRSLGCWVWRGGTSLFRLGAKNGFLVGGVASRGLSDDPHLQHGAHGIQLPHGLHVGHLHGRQTNAQLGVLCLGVRADECRCCYCPHH